MFTNEDIFATNVCPFLSGTHLYMYLSVLGHRGENENAQASEQQQRGFQLRLARLRVLCFTAELLHYTFHSHPVLAVLWPLVVVDGATELPSDIVKRILVIHSRHNSTTSSA